MGLLNDLVKLYKDSEAPEIFFYWAGISAISAVVKKNVYLDRAGHYKLYPNIYCFLVAASGMKKGVPISVARDLVTSCNTTRVISGRNSIQQILDDLGRAYSLEGGGLVKEAQGYLLSSELAAFLIKDPDALTILTDIHDTHYYEKEWKYSIKSGKSTLVAPCISLLGATNEEHFSSAVGGDQIGGGFIARTFIVYSNERGKLNPLTRRNGIDIDLTAIKKKLKIISEVKGEFQWEPEAIDLYEEWYYTFHEIQHNDPTGTVNRIGDQILKVAMCISLSQGEFLKLTCRSVKEAITQCIATLAGVRQVAMGGPQNLATGTKIMIKELISLPDHTISRRKLLMKYWGQFNADDLDKISETLLQAGGITINRTSGGIIYSLKQEALESYMNYKKSIN